MSTTNTQKVIFLAVAAACLALGGPALAGGFDAGAATRAYLDTVSGAARARSDAYFTGGYWLQLVDVVITLIIAWALLQSGYARKVRDALQSKLRWRWAVVLGFVALYLLVTYVLGFALSFYEGFLREHAYGLSTQGFGGWFSDSLKSLAVSIGLGTPAAVLFYAVLRRARRTWWLWGSGLAVTFLAFSMFIGPVFIAPLFNSYTPMRAGPLKMRILAMADANGVPADNVYVFDTSRQSNRITANVSGLWGTTRISLGDNLLKEGKAKEVEAVMGHEMGHYVLGHSGSLMVDFGLLILAGFAFVNFTFMPVVRRFGKSWGIAGIDDIAGLPLLAALLAVFFFFATPVTNSIIRHHEAQADIFGLNAARAPDGFAAVAMKLASYRKLEPGPLEEIVFFDHPSGRTRVAMAMRWKAAQLRMGATDLDPSIAPLAKAAAAQ